MDVGSLHGTASTPTSIKKFVKKLPLEIHDILNHVFYYIAAGEEFIDDPRTHLFTHDHTGKSLIIPIYNFNGEYGTNNSFLGVITKIRYILFEHLKSCFILRLTSGMDFRAYSHRRSSRMRCYLPLIVPQYKNSGVWVNSKSRGVKHFEEGKWIVHNLKTKHNVFNYIKDNDIIIFVMDIEPMIKG